MKKLFSLFKKFVVSCFLLYGYNLLAQPLNAIIPINAITVSSVAFLGVPALLSLILILVYVY